MVQIKLALAARKVEVTVTFPKVIWFVLAAGVQMASTVHAELPAASEYGRLDGLQSNIEWRQDYHVTISCIAKGAIPEISVSFETIDKSDESDVPTTGGVAFVLTVSDPYSQGDRAVFQNKMDYFNNFLYSTIKYGDLKEDGEDQGYCVASNIVKFVALDKFGKPRLIQWVNRKTGFTEMTVMFDDQQELLGMDFYVGLRFNSSGAKSTFSGSERRLRRSTLEQETVRRLTKVYKVDQQISKVYDLRDVVNGLLRKYYGVGQLGDKDGHREDGSGGRHEK